MKFVRWLIAALLAMGVTLSLFLLMHQLISSSSGKRIELDAITGVHFGPVEIPDEIRTKNRRKLPEPVPPKPPPPSPQLQISKPEQTVRDMPQINIPDLEIPIVGGRGMYLGNFQPADQKAEGDIIPLVVIRPMYPGEAAMAGIEGWVEVEFTITETGTVKDPRVVNSKPPRVFNREAIRAILKWKFKPRVVEGIAVERRATQIIDFSLDES